MNCRFFVSYWETPCIPIAVVSYSDFKLVDYDFYMTSTDVPNPQLAILNAHSSVHNCRILFVMM